MEQAATQGEAAAGRGAGRSGRRIATFAAALLLLFVAPGPMFMGALFVASVGVLSTPLVFLMRRERLPRHLRRTGRRLAFLLLATVLVTLNFRMADARLQRLVTAVHAYHEANGAFPPDLAALAPAHIERIPRATFWLTMNRFRWDGENGLLTCVPAPPLGWIGHDFRTDARVALD